MNKAVQISSKWADFGNSGYSSLFLRIAGFNKNWPVSFVLGPAPDSLTSHPVRELKNWIGRREQFDLYCSAWLYLTEFSMADCSNGRQIASV